MVEPIETDDAESDGEVELTVGAVVSSVLVVLSVLFEPSSLLLLQEMKMELKRRSTVKMMSIRLTRFPIGGLGEPEI
jgi:hypothetical protein